MIMLGLLIAMFAVVSALTLLMLEIEWRADRRATEQWITEEPDLFEAHQLR